MHYYNPPAELADTVFDPSSDTFGPIMAALQAGDFKTAASLTAKLAGVKRFDTYAELRDFLDGYTNHMGVIQGDPATIAAEAAVSGRVAIDDAYRVQQEEETWRVADTEPETDDDECEAMEIDGPPSGEYVGRCSCGRPLYRSHMAGTIYHSTEE